MTDTNEVEVPVEEQKVVEVPVAETSVDVPSTGCPPFPSFLHRPMDYNHNQLVCFGKHSDKTFRQLAQEERGYIRWLFSQEWFPWRYPALHDYLVKSGLRPSDTVMFMSDEDDVMKICSVSSHNRLQANYADKVKLDVLVNKIITSPEFVKKYNIPMTTADSTDGQQVEHSMQVTTRGAVFEHHTGVDLLARIQVTVPDPGWVRSGRKNINLTLLIEFKPSVSDDYPDVLRQIRAQLYRYKITEVDDNEIIQVLVTQQYHGEIPLDTVRSIFGDVLIVFV